MAAGRKIAQGRNIEMKDANITVFDKTEEFKSEIEPLLDQIKSLCTVKGIPFFMTACIKNDANGSEYYTDGRFCGSGGFILKDDRITKHFNVATGFDTVPHREEIEVDF